MTVHVAVVSPGTRPRSSGGSCLCHLGRHGPAPVNDRGIGHTRVHSRQPPRRSPANAGGVGPTRSRCQPPQSSAHRRPTCTQDRCTTGQLRNSIGQMLNIIIPRPSRTADACRRRLCALLGKCGIGVVLGGKICGTVRCSVTGMWCCSCVRSERRSERLRSEREPV